MAHRALRAETEPLPSAIDRQHWHASYLFSISSSVQQRRFPPLPSRLSIRLDPAGSLQPISTGSKNLATGSAESLGSRIDPLSHLRSVAPAIHADLSASAESAARPSVLRASPYPAAPRGSRLVHRSVPAAAPALPSTLVL